LTLHMHGAKAEAGIKKRIGPSGLGQWLEAKSLKRLAASPRWH
jgi:hypothetical protein